MRAGMVVGVLAVGYLTGTFPTALLVGRRLGFDPTTSGSGNPGTSNTMRIGGRKAGILVLVGDVGKGALAAGIGLVAGGPLLGWAAGAAAVAGHIWPVTRDSKGGKGVATAAGVGVVCLPVAMVVPGVLFALGASLTRRAAVGSMVAVCSMVPVMALLGRPVTEIAVAAATAAAVVARHRTNFAEIRSDGLVRPR